MQFAEPISKREESSYLEIPCDQFKILGRSVAGVETVITIPQWNITFDTGRAPDFAVTQDFLVLSHWHLDHAGGLAYYLGLRRLNSLKPPTILVPEDKYDATENYLQGLKGVSDTTIEYHLMKAEEPVSIRKDLMVQAIPAFHGATTVGYLVRQTKNRLKSEFKEKSKEEIIKARKAGLEVAESKTESLLAYSGDTTAQFFEGEGSKARYLLMECSFIGDDVDYDKIEQYGHAHISDWRKYAEQIQSEMVIMIHTSQRHSKNEIEAACRKELPKTLQDRLVIFR